MSRWGNHPAVYALEPVNEPWWNSDMPTLKDFYRRTREVVRKYNPDTKFVFHEAFHRDAKKWNDLFPDNDKDNVIMDTHQYMAWFEKHDNIDDIIAEYHDMITETAAKIKFPIWVGEWSLATEQCAMWLQGFNTFTGVDTHECQWVDCPKSYLPEGIAVDFDRTAEELGPFGVDADLKMTIKKGKCSTDSNVWSEPEIYKLG